MSLRNLCLGSLAIAFCAGCASTNSVSLREPVSEALSPVWSVKHVPDELVVSVSPAGSSLRIAGTAGTLIGAGIDAVANDRHRRAIREALAGYEPGKSFEAHLASRLEEAYGVKLNRTAPMGSGAGYANLREAEEVRLRTLASDGGDLLLDLRLNYGLYGYEGTLVTKIEGRIVRLPGGKRVWSGAVLASTDPILGINKLRDPTKGQFVPSFSGGLKVDDEAIGQWTSDGGATIRARFDESAAGTVSALLTSLELADEPSGHYHLGRMALNRKRYEEAQVHFEKTLAVDANDADAMNGLAVTKAHAKDLDTAIELARTLSRSHPDYAPGWLNLAWICGLRGDSNEEGMAAYRRAVELGMGTEEKIEKRLRG